MLMLPSLALFVAVALAAPPGPATVSTATADKPVSRRQQRAQAKAHLRPTRNLFEAGVYAGVFGPSRNHELYHPAAMWQSYDLIAAKLGLRFGFYPLAFLGLEVEGGIVSTKTTDRGSAVLGTFRGHAIAQLPRHIAPFVLVGVGMLGTTALGRDIDPSLHFGGGVKFYLNRWLALRFDLRDTVSAAVGRENGRTHHPEITLGLALVLGRPAPARPTVDRDGDGFVDRDDACPSVPGTAPDGCPAPPVPPSPMPEAREPAPRDDPREPEPVVTDRDADGIPDVTDLCPDEPETFNHYQDDDGCPDRVPTAVQDFSGVISGIFFASDSATIQPNSRTTLDQAVAVLREFPNANIEIIGHTDADGDHHHNLELSRRRAEAVKNYLVGQGIDPQRLTTRGAGPDEPIADNHTRAGKAKNRRIEFKLREAPVL